MENKDANPHDIFPEKKANFLEKLFTLFRNFFSEKETSGAGFHHTMLHRQRAKLKIASRRQGVAPTQLAVDQGVVRNVQIGNQTVSVYTHPNIEVSHDDVRQIKSGY